MLSDGEIAEMRTAAEDALPGTAVIETRTVSSDGGGGGSVAWSASGTVACRIDPASAQLGQVEQAAGSRLEPREICTVTLPADTEIDEKDRIISNGGTFTVMGVPERSWEITRRVQTFKES